MYYVNREAVCKDYENTHIESKRVILIYEELRPLNSIVEGIRKPGIILWSKCHLREICRQLNFPEN